jgi:hypothetical protein
MKTLRIRFLALAVAGILLSLGAGLMGAGAVAAQSVTDGSGSIACTLAAGNWTDCTVTLNQSVPYNGTVTATLPVGDSNLAFCASGHGEHQDCAISGNSVQFLCVHQSSCPAGKVFFMSVLGAPASVQGDNLTQHFAVRSENGDGSPLSAGCSSATCQSPNTGQPSQNH